MPIRLCLVLASFLVPAVADCAAPFVECRQEASNGIDLLLVESEPCVRRRFVEPWALPIIDSGPKPLWVYPFDKPSPRYLGEGVFVPPPPSLADLDILHPPAIPAVSLDSRRLNLHLDTAGVGRWDTALVELWITRDGWTWHLYQNAPPSDSLSVSLPGEGRYGLRVVLHHVDRLAWRTPGLGEPPQLWVEVDESLSVDGIVNEERCSAGNFLYNFRDFDQPGDVKQAKDRGLFHPCGYIKRVETEKVYIPHHQLGPFRQFTF